ncbi:YicC/YloC family endoribonuclease [Pseudomarimonas arenosa]|uniref:YicC family protein n=1 Tax=Pseudomarimonas arenosa TaxID=2774145 RepID=A0AAW3ZIF2_9GAMM|nr:YicC/YloC family endoribonuclease [Pseudomarimonas arenosa]MBD8525009.1 YicC family protein [Pseudomarimonas arenosa]
MIRSMTAYGMAEAQLPFGWLSIELRAVNHRYLDLSLRVAEECRALEPLLREQIAAKVQRGKLDCTLRFRESAEGGEFSINRTALDRLADLAKQCEQRFARLQVDFAELLKLPGVLERGGIDAEALQAAVAEVLQRALTSFAEAREREGEKLAELMRERLDGIEQWISQLRQWLPEIRHALELRMRGKLEELKVAVDPARIEQELVLQVQKIDVDEELDRLQVHVEEARRVLKLREPIGRRLDFLMQEFNREANTLGSKSVDSRTTQASVELKVLIEQLREQVQNIE